MQGSYSVEIDKLEKTVKEAMRDGYRVTVIINGEYYDIKDKAEKAGKDR